MCNNLALAIQMASVAEGMALGMSLGLDPKDLAGGIWPVTLSDCNAYGLLESNECNGTCEYSAFNCVG